MSKRAWRGAPAFAIAALALFVSLSGSVYAAKQAAISGKKIRVKSLPGNRVKPGSLPLNRLKPGALDQLRPSGRLTGAEINEMTLDQVPSATHAEFADQAQSAVDAQTALNAVNAVNAQTVNGHSAGCTIGTTPFAGACWEEVARTAATAPNAARHCAQAGGALPEALQLAAFAEEPGISLHGDDEWSGDFGNVTGLNLFSVVVVSDNSSIDAILSTNSRPFRCVIPLLS